MWKKIRKSKRPWYKPKPFFTIKQFFQEASMVRRIEWEHRKILLEEFDKTYQKWLVEKRDQLQTKTLVTEIMVRLENMLWQQNELRIQAEKNKAIDTAWSEKKQDEADIIFWQVKFILDVIGFRQGSNASEFLDPVNN